MNLDFNIESKKLALIQWLTSLNDVSMIDKILELKQKKPKIGGTKFLTKKKNPSKKAYLMLNLENKNRILK